MRVAQTGTALVVTAGSQNSTGLVEVSGSAQDLSALQVVLTATGQAVSVDNVAIGFGRIDRDATLGDEGVFDNLHVRLIDDLNANAILDAGEAILGTQTLEELEVASAHDCLWQLHHSPRHYRHQPFGLAIDTGNALPAPGTFAAAQRLGRIPAANPRSAAAIRLADAIDAALSATFIADPILGRRVTGLFGR
jgi:hypothetical protein